MKKVLVASVAVLCSLCFNNTANAQMKVGTFDEQTVLGLFPGIQQKIDSTLQKYLMDSLKVEYDYELSEYQRLDSTFKKDSATVKEGTRSMILKDLNQHKYKIVNWQQYQNQMQEAKVEEILAPYKQKVYGSLEKIIREQKYTHVAKREAFLIAPPQDDLGIKVALDLKLKFPKEIEDQLRAQGLLGSAPTAAPAKPATKPAAKN